MKRLAIAAVFSIVTTFLAAGCMWGIVTDDETGDPVGFTRVRWYDSHGRWGETGTGPNGLYVFDASEGDEVPLPGPVTFEIGGPTVGGCVAPLQERLVEYDDGPASDPWEIQNFAAQCPSDFEPPDFERPDLDEETATPVPTNTLVPSPTSTPTPSFRFRPLSTATPTPKPGFMVR